MFGSEEERDKIAEEVEQFNFVERVRPVFLQMKIAEIAEEIETLKGTIDTLKKELEVWLVRLGRE